MPHARRLLFVYNADWSLVGGLRYAAHRLKTGSNPCALCDITYSGVTEKAEWAQCRMSFEVPVQGVYRNQLDDALAQTIDGAFPCVVADTDEGYVRLLGPTQLEVCRRTGDPVTCLRDMLGESLQDRGLALEQSTATP